MGTPGYYSTNPYNTATTWQEGWMGITVQRIRVVYIGAWHVSALSFPCFINTVSLSITNCQSNCPSNCFFALLFGITKPKSWPYSSYLYEEREKKKDYELVNWYLLRQRRHTDIYPKVISIKCRSPMASSAPSWPGVRPVKTCTECKQSKVR